MKNVVLNVVNELDIEFLIELLDMIEEGATGFELAYEVEKKQLMRDLLYDGILFYNNFIEIGDMRFIDAPDKRVADFKAFKTVEETEKYIFIQWIREQINKKNLKNEIDPVKRYEKFQKSKKRANIKICTTCGAMFANDSQKFCEKCGTKRD